MSEEYWQKQKASGLISNVYNSTEQISGKYDNFNRCVIEINKNGVNDNSLKDFWEEWGDEDKICGRIDSNNAGILVEVKKVYQELYNTNEKILNDIQTIKTKLSSDYFAKGQICYDATAKEINCNNCIKIYYEQNDKLSVDLSKKQNEYNSKLSAVENRIKDLNNCSNFYT